MESPSLTDIAKSLTPKRQRFLAEYLVDLNATQVSVRAGYSERTAYSIGNELLSFPEVQLAIQEAQAERSQRTQVTADQVVDEWRGSHLPQSPMWSSGTRMPLG